MNNQEKKRSMIIREYDTTQKYDTKIWRNISVFMHRRKRECMTELSLKMAKAGAVGNHGSCRHTSNYKLGQPVNTKHHGSTQAKPN